MRRNDVYMEPVKFPAGLGYEVAGIADAVGPDATGYAVSDEVSVRPAFSMNLYFTYGGVITVPDYAVVRQPKSLSFAQAAAVWMMFVTAYGTLINDAKVGKGGFVLVSAASSSMGIAAIRLANYAGAAHVIVTDEVDLVQ
jgi:NADPH:quinone reductase-like Zn-dependent oxidoreductase